MNARDNTPLRTLIADRLAAGEDTAAGIAQAIGKGDTPSVVVRELNAMRTDGQVECEQRGKKKDLVYWLAVPLAVAADDYEPEPAPAPATISEVMLPPGVRHGTRAAQIYRVLPLYGAKPMTARQIATATGAALGLISPTLSGMVKAGQVSRVSSGETEAYGYTRLLSGPETVTQNAQPEVAKNTGSSASGSLSPSEGAAVQSKPAPVAAATPSAAPVAADVKPQTAEFPPQIQPQITPAQAASDEVERDDAMPPADPEKLAKALADAETSAANLVAHQNAIAIVPTLRSLIQSNTQHCPVCSQTYDGTGLLKQVEAQVSAVEAKIVEFKTAYETNRDLAASLSHTENVRKNTKAWLTSEHARLAEEAAAVEAATKTIPPPYTGPASGTIRLNLLSARAAEASRKALAAQIEQVEKYNAEWKIAQTVEFAAGEVLETVTSRISESLTSAVKSFLPEGLRERFVFSIDGCRFLMIGNDGRPHGRNELCGAEYAALTLALAQAWAAGSPYILLLDYRNDLADFDAYGVLAAVLQTIATTATADPNCLMVGITSPVGLPVTEFWHVINTGVQTPVTIDPSPVGSVAAPASVPGTRSLLNALPEASDDEDDGEEAPEEPAKPKRGRPRKATKLAAAGRKGGPKK